MTSTDLKIMMLRKSVKQIEIARTLSVHRCGVFRVIAGQERSKKIEKRIATILGLKPCDIWPLDGAKPRKSPTRRVIYQKNQEKSINSCDL